MSGEDLAYALAQCLEAGALDAYIRPIYMKKSRPGHEVQVLCRPADKGRLLELLLRHTSSLGVRDFPCQRHSLPREERQVQSSLGRLSVKEAHGPDYSKRKFAAEDLARLAREQGLSLAELRGLLAAEEV